MRVLVCGGRDYADGYRVHEVLRGLHKEHGITCLIEGGATGADSLARRWASNAGIVACRFDADWRNHGPSAGPKRNQQMLDEGKPDLVVAFRGGRGTADMCRRARAAGVRVIEVIDDEI